MRVFLLVMICSVYARAFFHGRSSPRLAPKLGRKIFLSTSSLRASSTTLTSGGGSIRPSGNAKDKSSEDVKKIDSGVNEKCMHKAKKPAVIFVLGGPGAGKGTQCEKLMEQNHSHQKFALLFHSRKRYILHQTK